MVNCAFKMCFYDVKMDKFVDGVIEAQMLS